jgi:hypothetical protein
MSLQTLMQAGPTKANELFTKLAETSIGAVKTRERLFAELKSELERHASLEEQHLFPILANNGETRSLVGEAIKDNTHLRTLLTELAAMPKNDEAFGNRLKEAQLAFKLHAMDEKQAILPAVQHALNDAQVQQIEQNFEAGMADAERARHAPQPDAEQIEAAPPTARQLDDVPPTGEQPEGGQPDGGQPAPEQRVAEAPAGLTEMPQKLVVHDQIEAVETTVSATAKASDLQRNITRSVGFAFTDLMEQAVFSTMDYQRALFWRPAERRMRFAIDVAQWWIRQNDSALQLSLSTLTKSAVLADAKHEHHAP